jgi:hypothetical protein
MSGSLMTIRKRSKTVALVWTLLLSFERTDHLRRKRDRGQPLQPGALREVQVKS